MFNLVLTFPGMLLMSSDEFVGIHGHIIRILAYCASIGVPFDVFQGPILHGRANGGLSCDFLTLYFCLQSKQVLWYGFRLLLVYLLVECSLHFSYTDSLLGTGYYKYLLGNTSQFTNPDKDPQIGCIGLIAFFCCGFLMVYLQVCFHN